MTRDAFPADPDFFAEGALRAGYIHGRIRKALGDLNIQLPKDVNLWLAGTEEAGTFEPGTAILAINITLVEADRIARKLEQLVALVETVANSEVPDSAQPEPPANDFEAFEQGFDPAEAEAGKVAFDGLTEWQLQLPGFEDDPSV